MPQVGYNIAYDIGGETSLYLALDTDHETAKEWLQKFVDKYIGKPYPNGKGFYPFTNARIVCND